MSSAEEHLLDRLRELAGRMDPPPAHVTEAARAALGWRTIDRELAELVYDSQAEERPLAGVRGGAGPRTLTFESDSLTVECEVTDIGGRRRLVGQVVPPGPLRLVARRADGTAVTIPVDELGRFDVGDLAPGPLSMRCEPAGARAVETGWLSI